MSDAKTASDRADSEHPSAPPAGLCLGCNYPLRGLASRRCPECGRRFDPKEPASINPGRPIGRIGRWMLRPVGRGTVLLGLAAAAALVWSSRLPAGRIEPSLADLR